MTRMTPQRLHRIAEVCTDDEIQRAIDEIPHPCGGDRDCWACDIAERREDDPGLTALRIAGEGR